MHAFTKLAVLVLAAPLSSTEVAAQSQVSRVQNQTPGGGQLTTVSAPAPAPVLKAKLLASPAGLLNQFGFDVALLDDTLFVGAPLDDTAGANAGAVYRYVRQDGTWISAGVLLPADADPGQQFGKSLAVNSLANDTLIVGSPGDSDVAPQRGAAYVFVRDAGGTWTQTDKITSADVPLENVWFGLAVALHGETLAVSAPLEDNVVGLTTGNVYVFERDAAGDWVQVAKLFPDTNLTPDGAIFGSAVAVEGDRIAIGQPYLGMDFLYGRAYVFVRGETGWSEEQNFEAPFPLGRDRFGGSLVLRGSTLVVGSPRDAPPLLGSVATFAGQPDGDDGLTWSFVESGVVPPDATTLNRFGCRLALDASGTRLLVGALAQDETGAAYLYALDGETLTLRSRLHAPDVGLYDSFGTSLAIRGNWIAVGAPFHDAGAEDGGAVYVYALQPSPMPLVPVDWH